MERKVKKLLLYGVLPLAIGASTIKIGLDNYLPYNQEIEGIIERTPQLSRRDGLDIKITDLIYNLPPLPTKRETLDYISENPNVIERYNSLKRERDSLSNLEDVKKSETEIEGVKEKGSIWTILGLAGLGVCLLGGVNLITGSIDYFFRRKDN